MTHPLDKKIFAPDTNPFERIKAVVARLRDPDGGCPWDLEQTHQTLTPYVIEEAFEVVEAITGNSADLPTELGDLLLQVLLHAQISSESGGFTIEDICERISAKLIKRHPHVFGDVDAKNSAQVLKNWEQIKQKELTPGKSILDGVPRGMPSLLRAQRVSEKAARVGFEWRTLDDIKAKVFEEFQEFAEACKEERATTKLEDEFGDILFSLTQVARRMHMNAEDMLHRATDKFSRRFKEMEKRINRPISELSLEQLDEVWEAVKKEEKGGGIAL